MTNDDDYSWSVDGGESSSDGENHRSSAMDSIEEDKAEEAAIAELTRRETRGVQMWRIFTLLTLVAVSVAVSIITFLLLRNKDVDEFNDSVRIIASVTPYPFICVDMDANSFEYAVHILCSNNPKLG
jgi:hypothetical protein